MTTVFERVKTALDTLSPAVPFALGQYLTAPSAELPDAFIAYFEVDGVPAQHADNVETHRAYRFQISYYSRAGMPSFTAVDTAMLAAGFTKGPDRQLPYDKETRHYGYARDYFYLE